MEALADLVSESLARYGIETTVDHNRLQWSKWFRCESSLSSAFVPGKPGLFALGEEVFSPGEGKRMLALFRLSEAEDLGMSLGRLFLPGSPEREHLQSGRCFARYAVIEDSSQRQIAHAALQRWMQSSSELASGFGD
jgi:hypothetical protein